MTQVLVVLGAKLHRDAQGQAQASPALSRRITAARALDSGGALFIATGGAQPGLPSEASVVHQVLCAAGIPPHRVLTEDISRNTFENLVFVQRLMRQNGLTAARMGIVSDRAHLPRVWVIARILGLQVRLHGAPPADLTLAKRTQFWIREAAALPLSIWRAALHRIAARP